MLGTDDGEVSSKELMNVAETLRERYRTVEEPECKTLEVAWDDVSGAALKLEEVKRARKEEIEYVHRMRLYDKVLAKECHQRIGKSPHYNEVDRH